MKQSKIFSLLGLAYRAGKVDSGEFMTEKSVKGFKARLVLVGMDASDNTKKKFRDMCSFYAVPCYCYGTKEELGRAIGKEMRASAAVTDAGFAKTLIRELDMSAEVKAWEK